MTWLRVFGIGLVVVAAGCAPADESSDPAPSTTFTTLADNEQVIPGYPPVANRWDVIPAIEDPVVREAAAFAAETASLFRSAKFSDEGAAMFTERIRPLAVTDYIYGGLAVDPEPPQTGGETYRATEAIQSGNGGVTVTVCRYNTPGVYFSYDEGRQLHLNPERLAMELYDAEVLIVERTTTADASSGVESDEPRLLVTSLRDVPKIPTYDKCNPYVPDPFTVAPPEPLAGPR